jgi:pimeloyl-ACP methyl ester carboxylesterase
LQEEKMPDVRVQAAITNWAPRFIAQGVDYNDFVRTTSTIERWDEWLDAWVKTGDMHTELALEAESQGRLITAGEAYVRAALCYHFSKFVWMVDMGKYRAASDKAIKTLYEAHRLLDPTAERIEVPFEEYHLVGNLRSPGDGIKPGLVILLPGLDSTKEEFFYWENIFLQRGMATLSMDGPGQGETGYHSFIRPDYNVAVSTMLDSLENREDIDLYRVGVVGVSLGGYYAPRAAAFEPRLKAVSAIGGPYEFAERWSDLPPITRETFVHHTNSKDEAEAAEKASKISLEGVLHQLSQPFLVVFGKLDRLIPWQQAVRVAQEAPNAELVMYDEGNHVCNNMPYRYRPLVGDWMREQLGTG